MAIVSDGPDIQGALRRDDPFPGSQQAPVFDASGRDSGSTCAPNLEVNTERNSGIATDARKHLIHMRTLLSPLKPTFDRLNIPPDCGDQITLKAKVNYRKFNWWGTQWSFAGVRDPQQADLQVGPNFDNGRWLFTGDSSGVSGKLKGIPDLPITVMAEDLVSLRVLNAKDKLPEMKQVVCCFQIL